jgi:hypothetical protein
LGQWDDCRFIEARQRYWKAILREHDPLAEIFPETELPSETKFIVCSSNDQHGLIAAFEDDGHTGYFYLYSSKEHLVVRHLHIFDNSRELAVSLADVEVQWSRDDTKCGVRIWGKMRGIIDIASNREGRVWIDHRDSPGIGDREWLEGF